MSVVGFLAVAALAVTFALVFAVGVRAQSHARANYTATVRAERVRAEALAAVFDQVPTPAVAWARTTRTGWQTAIDAGHLVAVGGPVPDPGNPGHHLVLAAHPTAAWGPVRALIATDPATGGEIAIPVPDHLSHPVQAAAWTYTDPGHPVTPSPELYADLTVRT